MVLPIAIGTIGRGAKLMLYKRVTKKNPHDTIVRINNYNGVIGL
jgi:hypothetical protein